MVLRKAGSLVYVGSTSRIINSVHRVGIAAINPITGQLLPFNPLRDESLYIYWLDIVVNTMCIEGEFTSFQGQNRNYLASLDLITRNVTSWNPNPDNYVYTVEIDNDAKTTPTTTVTPTPTTTAIPTVRPTVTVISNPSPSITPTDTIDPMPTTTITNTPTPLLCNNNFVNITIQIVDENNNPVSNAIIELNNGQKAQTDENGNVNFRNLRDETYTLQITKDEVTREEKIIVSLRQSSIENGQNYQNPKIIFKNDNNKTILAQVNETLGGTGAISLAGTSVLLVFSVLPRIWFLIIGDFFLPFLFAFIPSKKKSRVLDDLDE